MIKNEERIDIMIFPTIILKIERWKFNKEYGIYVSTLGNFKDRHKRRLPIMINNKGYCTINTDSGFKLAHRIVMLTWKPIPDSENLTVDHLNHNKRDNSLDNLEWVSYEENQFRSKRDQIREKAITNEKPKNNCCLGDIVLINGVPMPIDIDIIFDYLVKNYYPGGYPKNKIKKTIGDILTDKNTTASKKLGKRVTLRIPRYEEDNKNGI